MIDNTMDCMGDEFLFEGAKGAKAGGTRRSGRGGGAGGGGRKPRGGRGGGATEGLNRGQKAAATRRRKKRDNMTPAEKRADTRRNGPLPGARVRRRKPRANG